MTIKVSVTIDEAKTEIHLPDDQGKLQLYTKEQAKEATKEPGCLYLSQGYLVGLSFQLGATEASAPPDYDQLVVLALPETQVQAYLGYLYQETNSPTSKLWVSQGVSNYLAKTLAAPAEDVDEQVLNRILALLGVKLFETDQAQQAPKKPGKARHRWTKEVAAIDFFIDSREAKGTVRWQKRHEMLLKAGAVLKPTPALNKDGSLGFSAKMGEKIRHDYQASYQDFTTTEDIVLKSVNEVGLFLYFGGTNSWLELCDATGKTIDEWTVVA